MPDDTAEFESNSSVGSDSSPVSQLGDRTASTGLAEATMLGSSPDETSQPVVHCQAGVWRPQLLELLQAFL